MDAIFKALNDPTRRALLDALREKDGQTLTELEENLEMTRFGVMKHLKLLEEAHLIVTRKSGRFKYHFLNALPLQEVIDRWIDPLLQKPLARAALDLKSDLEGTVTMLDSVKPDFLLETYIRTSQDALWDALTKGALITKHHPMATLVEGDMKPGSRVTYKVADGNTMLAMEITTMDPKSRIEMTFEPGWAGPDTPKSRCAYQVEALGDACKLTIEHFEIPEGQDGVKDGWARYAAGLKSYLETGERLDLPMAPPS